MEAGSSSAEPPGGAGSFRDDAAQAARDAASRAKEEASDLLGSFKEQARGLVHDQKSMAADQIHGIAQALRRASEELDEHQNSAMAQAARRAAESVDSVAECVRTERVSTLCRYAEDFSRRNPGLVLGGAAAAAFLFARFLRASAEDDRSDPLEFEEGADEVGRPM